GVFATGLNSPANCRFKTLTIGVTTATVSGDKVIATGGATTFPAAAETFPLNVSAGVTLTTSDSVPTPANYTIDFNGASTAISLAGSSVFEGFTVSNVGGSAAASAVSVTGTGVTVDTVILQGTGGTT